MGRRGAIRISQPDKIQLNTGGQKKKKSNHTPKKKKEEEEAEIRAATRYVALW